MGKRNLAQTALLAISKEFGRSVDWLPAGRLTSRKDGIAIELVFAKKWTGQFTVRGNNLHLCGTCFLHPQNRTCLADFPLQLPGLDIDLGPAPPRAQETPAAPGGQNETQE